MGITQRIPLFAHLPENQLQTVENFCTPLSIPSRGMIFHQGDPLERVFFLSRGLVKIYIYDVDGREQIMAVLGAGEMFPHAGFFDETTYPAHAQAIRDTDLVALTRQKLERLVLDSPDAAMALIRVQGRKIRELQARLQNLTQHSVLERVAWTLWQQVLEWGRVDPEGYVMSFPLTHYELAKWVGTTRESANRAMSLLRKQGVIQVQGEQLRILQPDVLESLAGGLKEAGKGRPGK
ncbi:Crp/Fnr family transcriptional regulator [Kyrpidia tusciae]|uniref:Transcriptional regulator, Crp/Fnr family n=1 Tax=Kyrpidia tusciae (strain DSM 2912 / NBRC 15312 / T2) TaxID=562970 RepID=D5WTJ3_KYRT2|nr:Crp/Fnr family transcriptional regulator [Kyrpidia tusciae]ADG07229.1 transcriptional regulator, Crp/Fnr family [Kyrpidia tusciae DSM 2912]